MTRCYYDIIFYFISFSFPFRVCNCSSIAHVINLFPHHRAHLYIDEGNTHSYNIFNNRATVYYFYYLYRACGQLRPSKESFYRFLFSTGVSKNKNKKGGNIFFFKWWTQLWNRLEKLQRGGDK